MSQLKKRKMKGACYLCQKDNHGMGCDGGRPCSSCKQKKVPHMCFGMEIGSGRDSASTVTITEEPPEATSKRCNSLEQEVECTEENQMSTEAPLTEQPEESQPDLPAPAPVPSLPTFTPLSSPFNGTLTRPLKPVPSTFSDPKLNSAEPASQHQQQHQQHQQQHQQQQQQTTQTNDQIPSRQNNLNLYFMKELCKLKNDQKRLDEQLLELKLENSNLTTTLKNSQFQVMRLMEYFSEMADQQQQHHAEMHQPPLTGEPRKPLPALPLTPNRFGTSSGPDVMQIPSATDSTINNSGGADGVRKRVARAEQPMVVYDITKNSATVLTANATFCELLGYEMNEVIGMPWNKFIPPDAVARTMDILRQTDLNSVFQVEQVYRHKTSGVFTTWDTHTILFGNDGTPISDVVVLHLPGQTPPSSATPSHPLLPKKSTTTTNTTTPPLIAPTATNRRYLGWKKRDNHASSTTSKKKRTQKPKATPGSAPKTTPPIYPGSPTPPSGLYPLTPMPIPLGSKPSTPDGTSITSPPLPSGLYASTPVPFAIPLPEITAYPGQNTLSTSPSNSFSYLNELVQPQTSGLASPFYFQSLHEEESGIDSDFQRSVNISSPETTTTTSSQPPLNVRGIVDGLVDDSGEASVPTGGESFSFDGQSDQYPGGVEQDDAAMAAIDSMDMDSILHFLNMG